MEVRLIVPGADPANTKHLYNICKMSAQRLQCRSNIVQNYCFVFAGVLGQSLKIKRVKSILAIIMIMHSYGDRLTSLLIWYNNTVSDSLMPVFFVCTTCQIKNCYMSQLIDRGGSRI